MQLEQGVGGPQTLYDKIWNSHRVMSRDDGQDLLFIDRHFIHDVTAQSFDLLRERGLKPRSPERIFGTADHYVSSAANDMSAVTDPERRAMIVALQRDAAASNITLFDMDDSRRGIVHVVGPEQGLSLPGMTVVCADSHTSTHGAMGALAFGIGATEVAHVLATQCLWQRKSSNMRVTFDGTPGPGVTAKDLILAVIARIGVAGAVGHVIEYRGSAIAGLSVEARLTLCNMSIEAGGRAGMIAPDDTTFAYLAGRPFAPKGEEWDRAMAHWRTLFTDPDATFDREVHIDVAGIAPMVTWGTTPEYACAIDRRVPDPALQADPDLRAAMSTALDYMGLAPNEALEGVAIDRVFIGSCTNGRIEDMRSAAEVARGRHVASGVEAWVVPGSHEVRAQAEAEGLDRVFKEAGFQWRFPGCSMCLATNGDIAAPGQRCASTSNRNFVGRQGPGVRTHLMSPAMAAAAAVTGRLTDVRRLLGA
ncbi:isopropylmalate isomerase large subunit [Caballeronia turbans]|jgi:3-isopropylmalate/(R)-2-methylmalate dehydratase large subunit|uniref:3-isopropylmalate dehydratase large subunit n=1 Tax=unclassified Caballeronia TaxID=2646786 RepID=UPI00074C22D5|nr:MULTISPECIES: 3-isopropylmalate dehydratase large subunit [unclassified Caballeronia]SAL34288.1 isopropylmalate isomerase large subunit [Caballeronia turbans]